MKRTALWLLAAFFLYAAFLIVLAPAATIARWFMPAEMVFSGVEGRLLTGRMAALSWPSATNISAQDMTWRWHPSSLLRGYLAFDVRFKSYGGKGQFRLLQGVSGSAIADLEYRAPAALLATLWPMLPTSVGGELSLELASLHWWPQRQWGRAEGHLRWQDAALLDPLALALGNLAVAVEPAADDSLKLLVSSQEGALQISGSALLHADQRYASDLLLQPQEKLPALITNALALIGKRQTDGSYKVSHEGNLKELF